MDEVTQRRIIAMDRIVLSGIVNGAVYCYTKQDCSVEDVQDLIRPIFYALNEKIEAILTEETR